MDFFFWLVDFSPNSVYTMGFWRLIGFVKVCQAVSVSPLTQNVAQTIGFTTFSKINELWLQWQGRPQHRAAATASLFSKNLIKPMKYWHFFGQNPVLLIKPMKNHHFWYPIWWGPHLMIPHLMKPHFVTRNFRLQYFRCLPLKISSSEFHSILKMISASRRIYFEKTRNIRHWDRNSKISLFCHHGYVFVFKINNSGRFQKLSTYTIIWQCQKSI